MQPVSTQSLLIKRARQEVVFLAGPLIDRCVEASISGLQEAERRGRTTAIRMQLGDAWLALTRRRAELRDAFPPRVEQAMNQALEVARAAPSHSARAPLAHDELTLLEHAEVARFVEASRLQQSVMPLVEAPLARLDSLMSTALGLPVVRADLNPLRPDVLCQALLALFDEQPVEAEWRVLWVRHLAPSFAQELSQLYEAVTRLLVDQGVEEARYRLKLNEDGASTGASVPVPASTKAQPSGGGGGAGGFAGGAAPGSADGGGARRRPIARMADLAQAEPAVSRTLMRDFLYRGQWTGEHDEPLPAAYYEAVGAQQQRLAAAPAAAYDALAAAQARALAQAQSVVDRPARRVEIGQSLAPEQWGELGSAQARTRTLMALKSRATWISQVLGLDAVRALVGQVADDERVLAPVREAFVAMEPALLRLAMRDPRFLGDEQHPARRLVEAVAQRSFRHNDEFADEFEQFMAPVRQAVRELDALPQARPQDFERHLQALEAGWQKQDEGEAEAPEHGLRSIQFAQERQALADKVAWEFSLRSDLDGVPAVVADFLFQDWSLVIAHAQLTDTRGQLDPGGYLAVVSDLLWSVKREATLKDPARAFEVLPEVVRTLRRGLDMLGKDPAEAQTFFDVLMRCHDPVLRLRRMRSARDAQASGQGPLTVISAAAPLDIVALPLERPTPRAAEQPWLGRRELALAGFDHEAGDSGADSLHSSLNALSRPIESPSPDGAGDQADAAASAPAPLPADLPRPQPYDSLPLSEPAGAAADTGESAADASERARAQLAHLRTGNWVDLKVREQWRRARLHWCSDNGALFMFISRGGQPHSMTRRSCEKLLRARKLRPVESGAVVERALSGLPDAQPVT